MKRKVKMEYLLLSVLLLNVAVRALYANKAVKLDPKLQRCIPKADEEIGDDKFVAQMFIIFKQEATTKHASSTITSKHLTKVNGHELLGRTLFFIDSALRAAVAGKNETTMLGHLTELSQRYQSVGLDLPFKPPWPYRCYSADVSQVLDLYLSDVLLQILSLLKNKQKDLGFFLHGLAMSLPQLQDYVGEMAKPPISSMCTLIENSHDRVNTVREIIRTLEMFTSKSQVAQTSCSSPYDSHTFCLLPNIKTTLQFFLIDYQRARSSALMRNFAFLWYFEPDLSYFCNEPSTVKLKGKILGSIAVSEKKRLRDIIHSQLATENLAKSRLFIQEHVSTHFTRYAVDQEILKRLQFRGQPSTSEDGNNEAQKADYPSLKPTDNFLKCFNAFVTTLAQMSEAVDSDSSRLRSLTQVSLLWFTHPDFGKRGSEFYRDFLQGLDYFLKNTTALQEFGRALGKCGSVECKQSSPSSSSAFCEVHKVLSDVKLLGISSRFSTKVKILTPLTVHYRRILGQGKIWTLQSSTKRLQKRKKHHRRTLNSIERELSEHFVQFAHLAHSMAQEYAKVQLRMLDGFIKRIREVSLEGKLSILFQNILKTERYDAVKAAELLAKAIVESFNPFWWLINAPSIQDVLNQFSREESVLRKLGESFQRIYEKSFKIHNVEKTTGELHANVKNLLANLTQNREIILDGVLEESLRDNKDFEWSKKDIEDHTDLVNGLVADLCDTMYDQENIAQKSQAFGAARKACLRVRKDSEIVRGIYEEMNDFVPDFMEIIAKIQRALLIRRRAVEVMRTSSVNSEDHFSDLKQWVYNYRMKFQLRLHIQDALRAICDELEYKNGGVPIEDCQRALKTQSRDDSDKILSANVNECPSNRRTNLHVRIPGISNPKVDVIEKGYIDLTALYAGKETVFEIPFSENLPWLHRFASSSLPVDPDAAMFLKRFELFLPEMTAQTRALPSDVQISITPADFVKTMPSGEFKYGFSHEKIFQVNYGENKETCNSGFKDSPYPTLCSKPKPICVERRGELQQDEIAPPLYGKWLVRASLPKGLPIPQPAVGTSFYLRAVMSFCVSNPKNRDIQGSSAPISNKGSSGDCCPAGGYWNIDRDMPTVQFCLQCPLNSSPVLGGLYCHGTMRKNSEKTRQRKRHWFTENVQGKAIVFTNNKRLKS